MKLFVSDTKYNYFKLKKNNNTNDKNVRIIG